MHRGRCRLSIEDTLSGKGKCNLFSGYLKAKLNLNEHLVIFKWRRGSVVTKVWRRRQAVPWIWSVSGGSRSQEKAISYTSLAMTSFALSHTQVSVEGIASACELYTDGFTCSSISAHWALPKWCSYLIRTTKHRAKCATDMNIKTKWCKYILIMKPFTCRQLHIIFNF